MNTAQKLDYVSSKLGLIPAFGYSIGKQVGKAELALCQRYAHDARIQVTALEMELSALVAEIREHNGRQDNLGNCIMAPLGRAMDLLAEMKRDHDPVYPIAAT